MGQQTDAFNRIHDDVEEHHHQCNVLVNDLEQLVEDERQRYVARAIQDLDYETEAVKQLVSLDLVSGSRRVPMHDEPATNHDLGEDAADDDEQVQAAGDPGVETWPGFAGPI